ncbi:hypothetical protein Tco_0741607 [Tanacetum coccineum]
MGGGAPVISHVKKKGWIVTCIVHRFRELTKLTVKNVGLSTNEGIEKKNLETAFRTRYGHYEFQVMPFGLHQSSLLCHNGPHERVCIPYLDKFVTLSLLSIFDLIPRTSQRRHRRASEDNIGVLKKEELYAKFSKCEFWDSQLVKFSSVTMLRSRVGAYVLMQKGKGYFYDQAPLMIIGENYTTMNSRNLRALVFALKILEALSAIGKNEKTTVKSSSLVMTISLDFPKAQSCNAQTEHGKQKKTSVMRMLEELVTCYGDLRNRVMLHVP